MVIPMSSEPGRLPGSVSIPAVHPTGAGTLLLLLRVGLALGLLAMALLKLTGGYSSRFALPEWAWWSATLLEGLLGLSLLAGRVLVPALVGTLWFTAALLLSLFLDGDCGCLGRLQAAESQALRVAIAGIGGCACCLLLWLQSVPSTRRSEES